MSPGGMSHTEGGHPKADKQSPQHTLLSHKNIVFSHAKLKGVNYGGKCIPHFPLTLLKCSQNQPVMVELKNGETYSGFLVFCDRFMNLHMKNIICTSKDGDKFWKISECYVRGNSVKYIRVQDQAIDQAIEETNEQKARNIGSRGRGGREVPNCKSMNS
ncbi:U6 snRNA associated Sm-like protein Lsm4 [Plasmodium vivax Mauritania I]|uniref:U6 snRNA-associated Sm-like protein LSm4 n=1 Tax=Plasmodium vivax Mauritania I TaxID=1035515 RepID=A0A0J9TA83_PLAVI|nr:U6 snRNA associated Sm-like protein Lsm4 [Plasmodium vivax Mauritania I]